MTARGEAPRAAARPPGGDHPPADPQGRPRGRGRRHRVTGNRKQHAKRIGGGKRNVKISTAGWEFVHVCVDDATRLAYVEVLDDEKATTAVGFLRRAVAFYASHGITIEQLLTDNGSAYRSGLHAIACRTLGIKHLRTRPYRPLTARKQAIALQLSELATDERWWPTVARLRAFRGIDTLTAFSIHLELGGDWKRFERRRRSARGWA